jgi:hypothetical protein
MGGVVIGIDLVHRVWRLAFSSLNRSFTEDELSHWVFVMLPVFTSPPSLSFLDHRCEETWTWTLWKHLEV